MALSPSLPQSRSGFAVFAAAPHRMMFCAGAVQLVAVLLFWAVELTGRYTGLWPPLSTAFFSTWVHAFVLLYGPFPLFIFGFLMTTYPRWMNGRELTADRYVPVFVLMNAGILLVWLGAFTGHTLAAVGVALLLAGWARANWVLYRVYRDTPPGDKGHEKVLNAALAGGWLGAAAFGLWLLTDRHLVLQAAIQAGTWLYLLPVFVTVCHRMIPFFGSCVIPGYRVVKPRWSLPLLVVCALGHFALAVAGLRGWLWLADLPLTVLAVHHTLAWDFRRAMGIRLLAVLHIAFAWLGLAMALYTLQSLAWLLGHPYWLGQAPLHALTIGFFTAMVVGMATRVTLGHSGRQLVADRFTWVCFLGVNLAALLRVVADLPWPGAVFGLHPNLAAIAVVLAAVGAWTLRYVPMYLRSRTDGRPG